MTYIVTKTGNTDYNSDPPPPNEAYVAKTVIEVLTQFKVVLELCFYHN